MNRSRAQVHLIGGVSAAVIVLTGPVLVLAPLLGTLRAADIQRTVEAKSEEVTRAQLAELAAQNLNVDTLSAELARVRTQITPQDELSDASALGSAAAKSAGARVVAITFGDRQAFAPPTGLGLGDGGTPTTPQDPAGPDAVRSQIPVTFEVEVKSTAQAAAFLEGLRAGPRLVQVVEVQCSPTADASRFTVTVDALIFVAR
jgi:hypothetical protein